MAELAERDKARRDADREFAAAIHGVKLRDSHGRVHGVRQNHIERMKQRRGIH